MEPAKATTRRIVPLRRGALSVRGAPPRLARGRVRAKFVVVLGAAGMRRWDASRWPPEGPNWTYGLITVQHQPDAEVSLANPDEVLALLDSLWRVGVHPIIVTIVAHSHDLLVGVGGTDSFLQIAVSSGRLPYVISLGDPSAQGVVTHCLHGVHHTEISRCHLLPFLRIRSVVEHFIRTAQRSTEISWQEV
jgi:hypothetical protein